MFFIKNKELFAGPEFLDNFQTLGSYLFDKILHTGFYYKMAKSHNMIAVAVLRLFNAFIVYREITQYDYRSCFINGFIIPAT